MNTKSINDKIALYPILNEVKTELELRNLSPITVTNYMDGIARFLDFINYDNSFEITENHFRDYLFHLKNSDISLITLNCNNSFIRFFFLAVLNKPINLFRVPMAKFKRKDIEFLFDDQILHLLSATAFNSRIDCIVKLSLCCGLRVNEIVSLKVSDIHTKDKNNMCIFVRESKRNKSRYVPIDRTSYKAIQTYAKEFHIIPGSDDYFIWFVKGRKTCNDTIRRHFYYYRDLANIPSSYTFHCLRHTYAVNFLRAGGDLLDLKYRLGHSSLSTTSLYLHFSRNMMNTQISHIDDLFRKEHSHDH